MIDHVLLHIAEKAYRYHIEGRPMLNALEAYEAARAKLSEPVGDDVERVKESISLVKVKTEGMKWQLDVLFSDEEIEEIAKAAIAAMQPETPLPSPVRYTDGSISREYDEQPCEPVGVLDENALFYAMRDAKEEVGFENATRAAVTAYLLHAPTNPLWKKLERMEAALHAIVERTHGAALLSVMAYDCRNIAREALEGKP